MTFAEPKPTEVVVRVEAAPIHPSDLDLLLGGAAPSSATTRGSGEKTVVSLDVPRRLMSAMAARIGPGWSFAPELTRDFGMSWEIGGWLLTAFLAKIGPEATKTLQARVAREVKTTFASRYAKTVSLAEALQPADISNYAATQTGKKYLIAPSRGRRDDR